MASITTTNGTTIQGKQRIAVYKALRVPGTGNRILALARQTAPSMTYQDLRHILRDFEERGIAVCLNPECQTGRFHVLASALDSTPIPRDLVKLCARIGRAKMRLAVLEEVARERFEQHPLTATQIKKQLRERYPLGLNHVLGALKFLHDHRLVETVDRTGKRELKIYRITDLGKTILHHVLSEEKQPSGNSPTR